MAGVRLVNLRKEFGTVVAVNDLNLEITDGSFIALLGPSGCGKTTTLLMIAGLYRPTSGEIYFDEMLMNDVPPKDRHIGMVFQSYALYPHMTVYENIAFPLRLAKRPRREIDQKVREVAKLTQIDDLLDRRPVQLSGGQQQRVALCRALVKEPEVFLLDEPLSNLDARLRIETRAEIKRLQQELGITTILVTHDQAEAMAMAEKIAILHSGVLQQYAPPEELYARPRNLFVASFIGDLPMNLLPVRYTGDPKPRFVAPEFELDIPPQLEYLFGGAEEQDFILGIRPEDVELLLEPRGGAIPGDVYLTEPLGAGTLVHFRFGGCRFRVLAPREKQVAPGQRLWLYIKPENLHLFWHDGRSIHVESRS